MMGSRCRSDVADGNGAVVEGKTRGRPHGAVPVALISFGESKRKCKRSITMKSEAVRINFMLLSLLYLWVSPGVAAEDDQAALIQQARAAAAKKDFSQAVSLATRAIKAAPKQKEAWLLRAQLYGLQRDHAKAAADYSEVIKLDARYAPAYQSRGEAHFKCGKIAESIEDFDAFLKLAPDQKPHHWQRGISLYYAGRFADGKKQFELHQTVNAHDVENAVWHFLCTARAEGMEMAKKKLIPIEGDARVPMAQVHQLFAGKASPQDVLTTAQSAPSSTLAGEPLFYAHLYLGLYYEAIGDRANAHEYILKAAERSKANGYMGDVARVHAERLKKNRLEQRGDHGAGVLGRLVL